MVLLSKELSVLGCDLDEVAFKDLVCELHRVMHPAWTADELLCHPDHALRLAQVVRHRAGCPALPDSLILRTLMNCRKAGLVD